MGKGPVGFVNPVLYAHPEVLNDITNGTSAGCDTNGFAAIEGYANILDDHIYFMETDLANDACRWDPATGLGTPNYPKLKELFMHLP